MKLVVSVRSGKFFFTLAVIFLTALSALAQSRRIAPTPTPISKDDIERVRTEEIKLNVLAFDANGKFVPDVTARDIVITENNILHPPSSVRRLPANVLIVMDTGGELRQVKTLDETRRVARSVINALRPGDSMALLQYSDKAEIVLEWTNDKNQALAAINKTKFGRRSDFAGALNMARDFLMRNPADNRHLVLITDGTDSIKGSSAKFDALQRLLSTDISVHVLSYTAMEFASLKPQTQMVTQSPPPKALPDEVVATLPNGVNTPKDRTRVGPTINMDRKMLKTMRSRQADLENAQDQLEKVADATNGEFIVPNTVDEMVDKGPLVARMIDAAYVVTYLPKEPINDRKGVFERNIEVTSKRDGLVVQAKRRLVIDNGQ